MSPPQIGGPVTKTGAVPPSPRGVVPLRHLRHVPPDSVATLVNSLQNRVNSRPITLCVTLNANTGKIVLVALCIQI